MLTTTDAPDLITELRALAELVNTLTTDAMYIAGRTKNYLYGKHGISEQVAKLTTEKGAADPLGPAEIIAQDLRDLAPTVTGQAAELDSLGGEIWDRLDRMADLLRE